MASPSQRPALGALFLVLAAGFAGIAYAASKATGGGAGRWVIAIAAGVIAVWFGALCIRALRPR